MTPEMTPSHRVLLVEDSPGDADLIREMLGDGKHEIFHTTTLKQALPMLDAERIDVALLDLGLPDGFGVECVEAVRARTSHVPIVVLTGIDEGDLALACLAAGAHDYLSKQEVKSQSLQRAVAYAIARGKEARERRRADDLQTRLAAIVESSNDAIVSTDLDGIVTSWNRGAEEIFGFGGEEALGRSVTQVMRPADSGDAQEQLRRIAAQRAGAEDRTLQELVRLHKSGRRITVEATSSVIRGLDNEVVALATVCRDVTESRRRDDELRRRNAELIERDAQMRALTRRLHAVREEERTRISREVHDELGQLLTGLKMDLCWSRRKLAEPAAPVSLVADKLAEAEQLADRTLRTVQRIAVELRPSALDALGLPAAIRDEVRRFCARTGIIAHVEAGEASPTDKEVATALFRVFQELLTNIARHAQASTLDVCLSLDAGGWLLHVEDDGVGLSEIEHRRTASLGVLGMTERAKALGGTFELKPGLKRGTRASIRVPEAGLTESTACETS